MPKQKEVITVLNEFRAAWNKKDLNEFSTFLEREIISISPALKIGIVPIKEKSLDGIHHVLKSTKDIWSQFDTYMDPFEIINITEGNDNQYLAELLTHYPVMGITDINDVYFNKEYKIIKFHHKKITKYRAIEHKAPFLNLIIQGIKNKFRKIYK